MRRPIPFAGAGLILAGMGCDDSRSCTTIYIPALVAVGPCDVDLETEFKLSEQDVWRECGDPGTACVDGTVERWCGALVDRPTRYDVRLVRGDEVLAQVAAIRVEHDGCHPETVRVELSPEPVTPR